MNKTKSDYGIKIAMFIDTPKHMGEITPDEALKNNLKHFAFHYGDKAYDFEVTLHWAVEPYENVIKEAKYTYDGPILGIAVFHMLSVVSVNKNINQLKSVGFNALEKLLRDNPHVPAIDKDEAYVIAFAIDAFKQAIDKYTQAPVEYDNVTPLCPSHSPLSIQAVRTIVAEQNIDDMQSLYHFTKIDPSDKSCQDKTQELIDNVQREMQERKAIEEALQSVPFQELSEEQRIVAAETAIDQTVREYLVMDGGDIEILAVRENDGGGYDVYISYLGACSSCESSGGTLIAIQNALRDKLHPDIRVVSI